MNNRQLKLLALIAMFLDHFIRIFPVSEAMAPVANGLSSIGLEGLSVWSLEWIPRLLIYFGRLAAPIFMFCIVEGFLHTRSIPKYILRIVATAILSQAPYVLFHLAENRMYDIPGDWREVSLNILFTLGLGLLALWGYEQCVKKGYSVLGISIVVLSGILARLLHFEGGEGYILIIFTFYLLRHRPIWQRGLIFIPLLILARYRLVAYVLEDFTFLSTCILNILGPYIGIVITFFYSGEKGKTSKWSKKLMYAFYPLHLLVLAIFGYNISQ